MILAHPRGLVAALPAAGIPLAVALHRAYGADLLAEYDYAGADARAQGRSLLVVVIACMAAAGVLRWLALRIDRRMLRARIGTRTRTIVFSGVGIAALLALSVATAAFDLPDKIAEQHRAFERGNTPPGTSDLRTRLTAVGNNGRLAIWHVALEEAKQNELRGGGAGTYRLAWERDRPSPPAHVVDGHSLYYEVRAELGWIGIGLLLVVFAVPIAVAIGRLWGPGRHSPRGLPRRRHGAAAARDGGLGLGDAGAVHLVLRRRRRDHRRARGGRRERARAAAADAHRRRAGDPARRGDAADGRRSRSRA